MTDVFHLNLSTAMLKLACEQPHKIIYIAKWEVQEHPRLLLHSGGGGAKAN